MYVSQGKSLINGQKEEDSCDAQGQEVWKSSCVKANLLIICKCFILCVSNMFENISESLWF